MAWASLCLVAAGAGFAEPPAPIVIGRLAAPVEIDGDFPDPGWQGASAIDEFWEVSPGDNVAPKVRTTASLAYDDGLSLPQPRRAQGLPVAGGPGFRS